MTHAASGHTRVVKSGSSVTHAASGHTRVVKNVSNVTHAASGIYEDCEGTKAGDFKYTCELFLEQTTVTEAN